MDISAAADLWPPPSSLTRQLPDHSQTAQASDNDTTSRITKTEPSDSASELERIHFDDDDDDDEDEEREKMQHSDSHNPSDRCCTVFFLKVLTSSRF